MTESAVPLFVPLSPAARPISLADPLPPKQTPAIGPISPLLMIIAKIDHSGRIPAPDVIAALDWAVGDHTHVSVSTDAIIIRKATTERPAWPIDSRRQVFIPASARAQFSLHTGDRLLLVAIPNPAMVLVHQVTVVAAILKSHYATQRYPWHPPSHYSSTEVPDVPT